MPKTANNDFAPPSPPRRRLSRALADIALQSLSDEALAQDRLAELLPSLFSLPAMGQVRTVDVALSLLDGCSEDESHPGDWLLSELEGFACNRSVGESDGRLTDVLFAIPVVLSTASVLPAGFDNIAKQEIEELLKDCGVVSASSEVSVWPLLYSAEQLLDLSWGDVANLCSFVGADRSAGKAEVAAEVAPQQVLNLHLRYILGVVRTPEHSAEDTFPLLSVEETATTDDPEDEDGELSTTFGFSRAGHDENQQSWRDRLHEVLAPLCEDPPQLMAAYTPEGFYVDLDMGMQGWRTVALQVGTGQALRQQELSPEDLVYEIQPCPVLDNGGHLFLVHLYTEGAENPSITLEWYSLPEEPSQFALEDLLDLLDSLNFTPKTKLSDPGLLLLH